MEGGGGKTSLALKAVPPVLKGLTMLWGHAH